MMTGANAVKVKAPGGCGTILRTKIAANYCKSVASEAVSEELRLK
jgi:hypothetical protein